MHRFATEHDFSGLGVSTNGRFVAFAAPAPDGFYQIFVKTIGGATPPVQLTTDRSHKTQPTFSPDGARVAFTVWSYEAAFWSFNRPMTRALPDWVPRSIQALASGYTRELFIADLIAGVTVGLVALPLAMAFAIASGLTPQAGIYCAIITGFLISALGGSRFQIGGPTGAFVVVVSGIVATYGIDGLFMCTLMAGVMLVVMGLTGTGTAVKYIPRPVIIGFTNGIALVIISTQLRDFLGLTIDVPGEFIGRIAGRSAPTRRGVMPTAWRSGAARCCC